MSQGVRICPKPLHTEHRKEAGGWEARILVITGYTQCDS